MLAMSDECSFCDRSFLDENINEAWVHVFPAAVLERSGVSLRSTLSENQYSEDEKRYFEEISAELRVRVCMDCKELIEGEDLRAVCNVLLCRLLSAFRNEAQGRAELMLN